MKKILPTILLCLVLAQSFGQTGRKISAYLLFQYNKTKYDKTRGNNPWGMGMGGQAFFNNLKKFKPTAEFTADAYLMDDKVYRVENGKPLTSVRGMINLFGGGSWHPVKSVYLSLTGGPSFVGGQILFGLKPTVGFCFLKKQKLIGRLSYINIYNRGETPTQDFGSASLSLGVKLF